MAKQVAAFAHYGVKLTNSRWSWSGIAPNGDVVVGLWFDWFVSRTQFQTNALTNKDWKDKPGNRERVNHLIHARDNAGGRFRVVIMKANDVKDDARREVEDAYPRENMVMQLVDLDEENGNFTAIVVGERDASRS
jgi:hypothetical protein